MSSWTNKDIYVAYSFGSSTVNGYYYPSATEDYWENTSNNVSLLYGGAQWWLRETGTSTYYYAAEDDGSEICNNLIFASSSVYGVCSGEFPIGGIIYGGTIIQSSSSSSSEGPTSSSSSSSDFGAWALCSIASGGTSQRIFSKINMLNGERRDIGKTERWFRGFAQQDNSILYGFTNTFPIHDWGTIDHTMYQINPDLSITKIKDDMESLACVISDLSYEAIPGLYLISIAPFLASFDLNKYEIGTWNLISSYNLSVARPDLINFTALVIHNGYMYMCAWYQLGDGTWANKLVRIDSFSPFTTTDICDIYQGTMGLVSINNTIYGTTYGGTIFSIDLILQTYTITAFSSKLIGGLTNLVEGFISESSSSSSGAEESLSSLSEESEIPAETLELFQVLINQGHHDLIPFSYTIERGQENNSTFDFNYMQFSNTISYSSILNFNTISASTTSVFIPETEDAKYKHEPIFYVDIMVEGQGVNEYSLRAQQNLYAKENPTTVFNIPKFSWDNSVFGVEDESESSIDFKEGYVWLGTSDKSIVKVYYSTDSANVVSTTTTPSEVHRLVFGLNNTLFVSCYDNLLSYTIASYYSGEDDIHEEVNISNENLALISIDDIQSNKLISTESYQGNVVFRDRSTLETDISYGDFDAPFKVIWSKAHNCYLVAGTKTLWKFTTTGKTAVYNINGYSIVDFDCSEKGVVGIIFNNNGNYIIRFLDKNLYSILYNENVSDMEVRYCRYCTQGKFYILKELFSGNAYSTVNYLFNSVDKTMAITESINSVVTTTTTTTPVIPLVNVEIIYPIEGVVWEKGNTYDIKWLSKAAISDSVKIELFKSFRLVDTLTEETPNTGIFVWDINTTYDNGDDYKVKITWLSAGDYTQFDVSDAFTLTDIVQEVTTTTTTPISERAIGAEYNSNTDQVVIAFSNGLIGVYDLIDNSFNGLFETGVSNTTCIAVSDRKVRKFSGISAARVYVGDEPRLSNKWDSGIITTDKTSIYYGGGNNLLAGNKYYVHIQVYSNKYGWSETQIEEFIMPK